LIPSGFSTITVNKIGCYSEFPIQKIGIDFIMMARAGLICTLSLTHASELEYSYTKKRYINDFNPLNNNKYQTMKNGFENNKIIIFLHIPKTAGSSINSIINHVFDKEQIFDAYTITEDEKMQQKFINDINGKKSIKIIRGHYRFGLHEYIKDPSTYYTIFRNPVERVISHYYFVKRYPKHYLYDQVTQSNMGLKEYVTSGICGELRNNQVVLMIDKRSNSILSPNEKLQLAKSNLIKYFEVFGITERFDESLILLEKEYNWKVVGNSRKNVTINRPSKDEIPKETIDIIKEFNLLDFELYNYAIYLFDSMIEKLKK